MLKRKESEQMQMELVTYGLLLRPDHLLRKIDAVIDFSFIHDLCAPLYCADNGRPAIDPEILFRMLFVGYLYGIRSEVRLCEEIQDNNAYRWFCGLGLTEKVPDHATISVNRKRRFRNNDIAEQIFQEILNQAQEKGLVGGKFCIPTARMSRHWRTNTRRSRLRDRRDSLYRAAVGGDQHHPDGSCFGICVSLLIVLFLKFHMQRSLPVGKSDSGGLFDSFFRHNIP